MANNITEVLHMIQETTKKNLALLKTINESFYTQREHVSTIIDGERYTLPSFIYLESKLNVLEENFKNLVSAPQTGEAAFVFDGNTQSIQMQRYTTTPMPLKLKDVETFDVKNNALFKDLVTPNAFVRLNVSEIPNDITHVIVKKVVFKNTELSELVEKNFNSGERSYLKLHNVVNGGVWKRGIDFDEYDTEMRLPSIKEERYGEYHISSVVSQDIDTDFIQHYTVIIDRDPVFHYTMGLEAGLQDTIKVGDTLLCNNGTVKLRVDEVISSEKKLRLTVLNNAYANLTPYIDFTQDDTGVLTYFTDITNDNKYIDVTLEEDDYVAVFVAPLNKLNVQASFGEGTLLVAKKLLILDKNGETISDYRTYYDNYINNVGDTLANLTKVFNINIFQIPYSDVINLINEKPILENNMLDVFELNAHLKNNIKVKEISKYHKDKSEIKSQITSLQGKIDDLRNQIKTGQFTGEISGRKSAETQLNALEAQINAKNAELVDTINAISTLATEGNISLTNAKYRIRGFYDVKNIEERTKHKVIRIIVQYQYASSDGKSSGAQSITSKNGNINYLISDWTTMESPFLCKRTQDTSNKEVFKNYLRDEIVVEYPPSTQNQNVPSFNQIDIPINQGEIVNIRVRVQFEDGYPFFETLSDWSNTVTIQFPDKFASSIPVMTMIEENINDADKYRFIGVLNEYNITEHVKDEVVTEEGATFFHKCEHVTSGFYTAERRDIPLSDKLRDMDTLLNTLENEIYGLQSDELKVTLSDQINSIELKRDVIPTFFVPGYDRTDGMRDTNGNAKRILNLTLMNTSNYKINLYSLFPGEMSSDLTSIVKSRFNPLDYCVNDVEESIGVNGETSKKVKNLRGVWMECFSNDNLNKDLDVIASSQPAINFTNQHLNQFIYFRLNNPNDGAEYYSSGKQWGVNNILSLDKPLNPYNNNILKTNNEFGASLVPMLNNISQITIPTGTNRIVLDPGQSISIPLDFRYLITSTSSTNASVEKTMSFDIRPSLYADPMNFTFKVCANFYDLLIPATVRTPIQASPDFITLNSTSMK